MKPVLVMQHMDDGGPGYFARFLDRHGVPYRVLRPDRGELVPGVREIRGYSGICLCGGVQSANDDLPWLRAEMDLVRHAADRGTGVIGHCLGGQLISRALGGRVRRDSVTEFGWQSVTATPSGLAAHWLGSARDETPVAHWHYDSFTVPPGATSILTGEHCPEQAFVLGNVLAMQFHAEVTGETVRHWTGVLRHHAPQPGPGVQHPDAMLADMERNLPLSMDLADRLYGRWLEAIT